MRLDLVGMWAACWAVAAIAGVGGFAFDGTLVWVRYVLLTAAACLALVPPNYRGAKARGSRHPVGEATVWAAGAVFVVLALMRQYDLATGLAAPGDLNVNTTETIRHRQQLADWGLVQPGLLMAVTAPLAIMAVALLAGMLGCGGPSAVRRALGFSVCATAGIVLGVVSGAVAAPIIGHLASMGSQGPVEIVAAATGFVAGAAAAGGIAGTLVELGREKSFS
jgi:hypothetical protein